MLKYSRICLAVVSLALLAIGVPGDVSAHGPTIKIDHQKLEPALLNLFVGTTVHFVNTVTMPGGYVLIDDSGAIESPALEKAGDDWHYTFEKEGSFEIYIKQHPKARARIVVVKKR